MGLVRAALAGVCVTGLVAGGAVAPAFADDLSKAGFAFYNGSSNGIIAGQAGPGTCVQQGLPITGIAASATYIADIEFDNDGGAGACRNKNEDNYKWQLPFFVTSNQQAGPAPLYISSSAIFRAPGTFFTDPPWSCMDDMAETSPQNAGHFGVFGMPCKQVTAAERLLPAALLLPWTVQQDDGLTLRFQAQYSATQNNGRLSVKVTDTPLATRSAGRKRLTKRLHHRPKKLSSSLRADGRRPSVVVRGSYSEVKRTFVRKHPAVRNLAAVAVQLSVNGAVVKTVKRVKAVPVAAGRGSSTRMRTAFKLPRRLAHRLQKAQQNGGTVAVNSTVIQTVATQRAGFGYARAFMR